MTSNAEPQKRPSSGNKRFVLNVDDDADDGFLFMEAIKDTNSSATCLVISSGKTAVQLLSQDIDELPDYIFLDINMPGMDGRECLAKLRSMPRLKGVAIIMFSTSISNSDKEKFLQLNASAYQKPSDYHSLKSVISKILSHR